MSTFNNPPAAEGDAISATNLNAKAGTALETPVNDLDESSIERYALDSQHLPALSMSDIFSNGYEKTSPVAAGGNPEFYGNTLPLSGGPAYPYTYQTFDTTAGTNAPNPQYYGPAALGVGNGWRIPGYLNAAANYAEIALASATNFTTAEIKGVICEGSIEPYDAVDALASGGGPPSTLRPGLVCMAIAIGFEDGLGARYVVERSVRFYSVRACDQGNASTSTFLTQTDLDAGDGTCAKIFLAVASCRPGAPSTNLRDYISSPSDQLDIEHYNLSVLPLKAGDL